MGGTSSGAFKGVQEEKKLPYGQQAPYANAYSKPLNETQVNGTFPKRAQPNNINKAGQTTTGGGYVTTTYGRSGTATGGGGVKEALTYQQVPAPKIATTNVRVSIYSSFYYSLQNYKI